ncbi:MAG: periplasmic heavy metal sensor [Candidatus Aegiribacteria sp.]|nr:periplasmic heavy metal sensor [Candidatus Aegiribacteria sp.]MBD3293932.1 periplasmic heavy metal sensor [Candidatus Fermentibacteria bacterium]
MFRRTGRIGIVFAITLLAATAVFAQGPSGMGGHGGGPTPGRMGGHAEGGFGMEQLGRFRMMFRGLDLSDSQKEEIRSIVETARDDVRAIVEEAGAPEDRTPFIEIFTQPTLTVSDLEENFGAMDEVREAARDIIMQAIVDVHDVLTAEQLEELASMADEHGLGMGPGPEHGMGMVPGGGPAPMR